MSMGGEHTDFPSSVEPSLQRDWDLRGTANFMLGGAGCGLLVVSGLAAIAGMNVRWPLALGLILVAGGLLAVLFKIGQPRRALNVIFNPRTSWMSREALTAGPLFAFGLAAIWFNNAPLALATAAVALFYLYCQGRILTSSKGIPAWREPVVTPLIMASGLAEGAGLTGMFLILGRAGAIPDYQIITLPGILMLCMGMLNRYLAWMHYLRVLREQGAPTETLRVLEKENVVFSLVGHGLPTVILGAGLFLIVFPMAINFAGLFVLYGGWRMKMTLINRAGHGQGISLPVTPSRGGGLEGAGIKPGWSEPG